MWQTLRFTLGVLSENGATLETIAKVQQERSQTDIWSFFLPYRLVVVWKRLSLSDRMCVCVVFCFLKDWAYISKSMSTVSCVECNTSVKREESVFVRRLSEVLYSKGKKFVPYKHGIFFLRATGIFKVYTTSTSALRERTVCVTEQEPDMSKNNCRGLGWSPGRLRGPVKT